MTASNKLDQLSSRQNISIVVNEPKNVIAKLICNIASNTITLSCYNCYSTTKSGTIPKTQYEMTDEIIPCDCYSLIQCIIISNCDLKSLLLLL